MLRWDQEHYDVLEMAVFAGTLPSEALLSGLAILVGITDIEEIEIFKMCLEFWKHWSNQQFLYDRNFVAEAQAQAQVLCVEPASSWCIACRHVCAHGSLPWPHPPPPTIPLSVLQQQVLVLSKTPSVPIVVVSPRKELYKGIMTTVCVCCLLSPCCHAACCS